MTPTYILTLSCPDRTGIVHAVSGFLLAQGANIEEAAQYNDQATGLFFMRVRFACAQAGDALRGEIAPLAQSFSMRWSLHDAAQPMRTVIMVSREGHCLNDLLFRCHSGLLALDVRAIISNHRDFYQLAASYNIPFHHFPLPTGAPLAEKHKQEDQIIALADRYQVDELVCRSVLDESPRFKERGLTALEEYAFLLRKT